MAIIKIRNAAIDLDAAEIPNLPASKITSGTLDNARISLDAAEIPNLDTAKITSGTLADARVPNLNASKITAGTIATARLGSGTASSSTFLRGDGSFATPVGGVNTPSFLAYRSSVQDCADNTYTKIQFNSEKFDITNTYDSTVYYRFTPGVSGKYFLYAQVGGYPVNDVGKDITIRIYKNGSTTGEHRRGYENKELQNNGANAVSMSAVYDSNTTDYFEVYWRINTDNSVTARVDYNASSLYSYFGGYKIIT